MDFVTGFPPSIDNTVILTIVDSFSKATHFVLLFKLPSAKEKAQIVIEHVSVYKVSLLILFLARGLKLRLSFGRNFAVKLALRPACRQSSILKLMVKSNTLTRFWVICSALWPFVIPRRGASNCRGLITPIIFFPRQPQGFHPFSLVSGTSSLCSPPKRQRSLFPWSKRLYDVSITPGEQLELRCARTESTHVAPTIAVVSKHPDTFVVRKCGFPLRIYPCRALFVN